MGIYDLKEIW